MRFNRFAIALVLSTGSAAGLAQADTIVTFADPAMGPATPLFTRSGNTLTGGWASTGLTLETPGLPAGTFLNARFNMPVIPIINPVTGETGPGVINFTDSANNPLFTISFAGGVLFSSFGFGASDFQGWGVTFAGPIIPFVLSDEAFAFSFANPAAIQDGFTVTSSFTSSAVIPAPASAVLLGMGGLMARRRRR